MKSVFSLIFLFLTPVPLFASVENEAWQLFLNRFIGQYKQKENFVSLMKNMDIRLSDDDKSFIQNSIKAVGSWPQLLVKSNRLYLLYGKAMVWIELKDANKNEFIINGKTLVYNPKVSVILQLRNTLNSKSQSQNIPMWYQMIIKNAWAIDPVTVAVGQTIFQQGAEGLGLSMMADGLAAGSASTTVGLSAASLVATTAAIVVGGATVVGGLYCGGHAALENNKWDSFLNCASSPLSLLGINPRDILHMSQIDCKIKATPGESAEIDIQAESSRGERQYRRFYFDDELRLKKVEIKSIPASSLGNQELTASFGQKDTLQKVKVKKTELNGTGKIKSSERELTESKNIKQWKDISNLSADFHYYQDLCRDSKRLSELQKSIKSYGKDIPISIQTIPKGESGVR